MKNSFNQKFNSLGAVTTVLLTLEISHGSPDLIGMATLQVTLCVMVNISCRACVMDLPEIRHFLNVMITGCFQARFDALITEIDLKNLKV